MDEYAENVQHDLIFVRELKFSREIIQGIFFLLLTS